MKMHKFLYYAVITAILLYIFLTPFFIAVSIPFLFIKIFSISLILWAVMVKKIYKQTSKEALPKGIYLITEGPYEFIRHPIYAGFILFVSSTVQDYFTFYRFLAFLIFLILMLLQINRDEKATEQYFKHKFTEYKKKSKILVPYIY